MRMTVMHEQVNASNDRGLSHGLFLRAPLDAISIGSQKGIFHYTDFLDIASAPAAGLVNGFTTDVTGAKTTDYFGAIDLASGALTNDVASIQSPTFAELTSVTDPDTDPEFGFEFRVKVDRITTMSIACGFTITGTTVDDVITDTTGASGAADNYYQLYASSANADMNFVPVWTHSGGTLVTETARSDIALAASTWIKLGMRTEWSEVGPAVQYFVNGTKIFHLDSSINSNMQTLATVKAYCMVKSLSASALTLTCDQAGFYSVE